MNRDPRTLELEEPDRVGILDFISIGVGITAKLWDDGLSTSRFAVAPMAW